MLNDPYYRLRSVHERRTLYNVTARGNGGQTIFLDDVDRESFLTAVSEIVRRLDWLCHGYCLMGNHYHLLIETRKPNLFF
ncbi:MAG: transposase [Vicinamibacteria bacterium]|nr:transposase [Vicinamibacteria bacterium]